MEISIHTLAWRVTVLNQVKTGRPKISIHTLAWRVTATTGLGYINLTDFNPHPRVEGDS